jgi:hypothetical protein
MPLPLPNLDDRDFNQLLEEATKRIRSANPDWDDLSPSDPGIVLLELFAYLTETMIYRLNRLPHKVYIALLRLLGVSLQPPGAARVMLQFSRAGANKDNAIEIPRGTRVTLGRGGSEPPLFVTTRSATLAAGEDSVDVEAFHGEQVDGELLGTSTGQAGLSLTVARPPIIRATGDPLDLVIGVEASGEELGERAPAIEFGGKSFRIWREVPNFSEAGEDAFVYIADRATGTITFAPALYALLDDGSLSMTPGAMGEIPPSGREIRAWYRRGGGAEGNVAGQMLTVMKDPITGLQVTNPSPATGGRAAETLDNALARGPKELHSLERAVTAQDFELIAMKSSQIARARAFTRADLWSYADRGTVEVLLVPYVPPAARAGGRLSAQTLVDHQTDVARQQVQTALDQRRPLGTACLVQWARCKEVRVSLKAVVRREEDAASVKTRVLERLNESISPLGGEDNIANGFPFGQSLRISNIYDIVLSEPGVRWVDDVRLQVDSVPEAVSVLAADHFQAQTWYAASGRRLFRSTNDGDGWELMIEFPEDERIELVRAHPEGAGMVALTTRVGDTEAVRVHISRDCGDTWLNVTNTEFHIEDLAWLMRDKRPLLLLATDKGLYELAELEPNSSIVQVLVVPNNQSLSFYAVTAVTDARGQVMVAVAAQNSGGVYLSGQGGRANTFRPIEGVEGKDVRVLAVQTQGTRRWLWAGTYAFGEESGAGCLRWELRGDEDPVEGWQAFASKWEAGSCRSLCFAGSHVFAASHRGGVLRLNADANKPAWEAPDINSGLPLRDLAKGRFLTIESVAAGPQGAPIMAGVAAGEEGASGNGIYRSREQVDSYAKWTYELCTERVFTDKVTLPETWLLTSGEHEVTVVSELEAR